MSKVLNVGVIGCGNISKAYLRLSAQFRDIEVIACADLNADAAAARSQEFGVRAMGVDEMLASKDIDIVVNLTIPEAHFSVSMSVLNAGKHVYSEKPFVLSLSEGRTLLTLARERGLRIGSAPDTFLGGAHQHARHLVDTNTVGRITSGTAHVMGQGMEHWHPNPDFFFRDGAGPMLDIGPYYVTNMIQLLGSVERVMAMSNSAKPHRTITSEPRAGEQIPVETPTTLHALLEFTSGAIVTLGTSWDVQHHTHSHMQLYGDTGTLYVPDPNFFGGEVSVSNGESPLSTLPPYDHPLSTLNELDDDGNPVANYRTIGLADMACAIKTNRPHRCSGEMALHAIDIMVSIIESGSTGSAVSLSSKCERPKALTAAEAMELLAVK